MFTLSNVADTWSQRLTVEEWHISESNGNRIESMVAVHHSTSSGTVSVDPAPGRMVLTTTGSNDAPLSAWFDGARKLRVYGIGESGSGLYDYVR